MLDKAISGKVVSPTSSKPIVYTDGSVSKTILQRRRRVSGWGYIGRDGKFGLGSYIQPGLVADMDPPVIAELKAIYYGLLRYSLAEDNTFNKEFIIVYSDSLRAISRINIWRKGDERLPIGYTGTLLEKFRLNVYEGNFNFEILHVKGHSGDVLNTCADTLAHLGMRWNRDKLPNKYVKGEAQATAKSYLNDNMPV